MKFESLIVAGVVAGVAASAGAGIRITEYMYQGFGNTGEFFELTNLSNAPIDINGWFFLDDRPLANAQPGDIFDLSFFGVVAPGESIVITEDDAAVFSANWNLPASVRVLGGLGDLTGRNLGRNDAITIFDANENIVDELVYGDQNFPGSIRTQRISGNPLLEAIGQNDPFGWVLSFDGDGYGSWVANNGDIGNPGFFIPAPGAVVLMGLGGLMASRRRR